MLWSWLGQIEVDYNDHNENVDIVDYLITK